MDINVCTKGGPKMITNYIGADVDCKMTELAVERSRQIVTRERVPTNIRSGTFLAQYQAASKWSLKKVPWLVGSIGT